MTPETIGAGWLILTAALLILGALVVWFTCSALAERMADARVRRLEVALCEANETNADLLAVSLKVVEDNIGLAYDLEAATDRVSVVLDVEVLAKPGTTVTAAGVVPAQRSPYDYEKGGL